MTFVKEFLWEKGRKKQTFLDLYPFVFVDNVV